MRTPYEWKSDLAGIIQRYVQEKKQTGFKFEQQERYLRHFDSFYYYRGYGGINLTKLMLNEFIYNEEERPVSHYNKEVVMKNFAVYLHNHGYVVCIPEVKTVLPRSNFIPHIYTKEELQRFFLAVDNYPKASNSYRNTVDPVLFRFLYGTGARLSEALNLTMANVDLNDGIVTIRHAKNNKDRLIPIAQSLTDRLRNYMESFHRFSEDTSIVFPGAEMRRMDQSLSLIHISEPTRLGMISYAVFCLKKKKQRKN